MLITDQEGLAELCEALEPVPSMAIDTEFASERRYHPRFDLLQIGIDGLVAAIDVRADLDFTRLWEILCATDKTIVLHSGTQDISILWRWMKRVPAKIFDTQVAAALLGFGPMIAYGALVKELTGIELEKSESLTDWSQRPLSDPQIQYALDDVRYLLQVRASLEQRLQERGRTAWLEEECARMIAPETLQLPEPEELWRQLFGYARLEPREKAILREVVAWRETSARKRNTPPRAILPDEVLLHIARHPPTDIDGLRRIRKIFERTVQQFGKAILKAIHRGLEFPEESLGELTSMPHPENLPSGVVQLLDAVVRARAEEVQVASRLLVEPGELQAIVRSFEDGEAAITRVFSGWRNELVGRELRRVLDGKSCVCIDGTARALRLTDCV